MKGSIVVISDLAFVCLFICLFQDEQLQVGDQILSVDGQQILGYKYEKVRMSHCMYVRINKHSCT